jgi:hypothetical protein
VAESDQERNWRAEFERIGETELRADLRSRERHATASDYFRPTRSFRFMPLFQRQKGLREQLNG